MRHIQSLGHRDGKKFQFGTEIKLRVFQRKNFFTFQRFERITPDRQSCALTNTPRISLTTITTLNLIASNNLIFIKIARGENNFLISTMFQTMIISSAAGHHVHYTLTFSDL